MTSSKLDLDSLKKLESLGFDITGSGVLKVKGYVEGSKIHGANGCPYLVGAGRFTLVPVTDFNDLCPECSYLTQVYWSHRDCDLSVLAKRLSTFLYTLESVKDLSSASASGDDILDWVQLQSSTMVNCLSDILENLDLQDEAPKWVSQAYRVMAEKMPNLIKKAQAFEPLLLSATAQSIVHRAVSDIDFLLPVFPTSIHKFEALLEKERLDMAKDERLFLAMMPSRSEAVFDFTSAASVFVMLHLLPGYPYMVVPPIAAAEFIDCSFRAVAEMPKGYGASDLTPGVLETLERLRADKGIYSDMSLALKTALEIES